MAIQLKIQIRGIKKPPVWRRLIIPESFTFAQLHLTIQHAFGWWDEHLYQFQKSPYDDGWRIESSEHDNEIDWNDDPLEAEKTNVSKFVKQYGLTKFVYVYDFGDDWVHDITVEDTEYKYVGSVPQCLGGKGACPPEDCGGIWGYEEMKEDMDKDEYTYFSLEDTNETLQHMSSTKHSLEEKEDENDEFWEEENIPQSCTLMDIVSRLDKESIKEYANALFLDMGQAIKVKDLRARYVQQILDNPKRILSMLPFEEFCMLQSLHENPHPKNLIRYIGSEIDELLIKYGLVDEWNMRDSKCIQIPTDLLEAIVPYIDKLHDDENYHIKVSIESFVTGMANTYGMVSRSFVLQEMVRHEIVDSVSDAAAELSFATLQSLQLQELYYESDDYESEPDNDNCYYVSRFVDYWPIALIEGREKYSDIVSNYKYFSIKELLTASEHLPVAPNAKQEEFCNFLTNKLKIKGLDVTITCHDIWFYEINQSEALPYYYDIERYFEEEVLDTYNCPNGLRAEAWEKLNDYLNNMPHWQLMGHTPQETGVLLSKYNGDNDTRKKPSLLDHVNKNLFDALTPTKPYVANKTPRPNDPCPCGSGKKYKKCCGK